MLPERAGADLDDAGQRDAVGVEPLGHDVGVAAGLGLGPGHHEVAVGVHGHGGVALVEAAEATAISGPAWSRWRCRAGRGCRGRCVEKVSVQTTTDVPLAELALSESNWALRVVVLTRNSDAERHQLAALERFELGAPSCGGGRNSIDDYVVT